MMERTIRLTDQMGRQVLVPRVPQRVVSLCPSLTETLLAMGIGERLVGRTRFCIHPAGVVKGIVQVGGTKDINFKRLASLSPDLIIGEKEENTPEMIAELEGHYPVLMTDVVDLASAAAMMGLLGTATGLSQSAMEIAAAVEGSWERVDGLREPVRCLYLIWKNPWMAVGANTFIDSVLKKCGFLNVAGGLEGRYPMLEAEDFVRLNPQVVLLSTEPFPFKDAHVADFQEQMPGVVPMLVDGEMFSWYGSHMVGVENYLNLLLFNVKQALYLQD